MERTLILHRFPKRQNETLQAWDAGDEYLIQHIEEMALPADSHIVILNDHFGALCCWFADQYRVTMMSDSFIAQQATQHNLAANQCRAITLLSTMDEVPSDADVVLIQLPKSNRHLVWQLHQLRRALPEHIPVIGVNKAREIHTSTLKLFEQHLGTTTTSLAWKKHRLIFSQANVAHPPAVDESRTWEVDPSLLSGQTMQLKNRANVYSGESLDLGARFLLPHLPQDARFQHIIDLGCGNGVLSVQLGRLNPQAQLTCVDESFMAVASAQQNIADNLGEDRPAHCIANNCLDGFDAQSASLIVCNPPFHQQLAITDHIAWQMFCDAKRVLAKEGQLLVIGNRHLGYDGKLTRLFGRTQVKTVAANKKFVILQATKS